MKQGFELKWSTSVECGSCEASGGLCVYADKQTFSCSCGKGRRYANCREKGLVSSNYFKLGLLSIGLLICCVIIAITILYIVKKRKDGIHKRGFNRLPTSGK
ncbi:uncharacterized protein LOC143582282 [Bidens hawaiensis]|uniref:uncharacterized protein LOC143582282 n=1 Tax=Bidens hawaiensis TaxID=980011 RepID=UPI004049F33C